MQITIYGASDDLVEVEGCAGADEFSVYSPYPLCWYGELIDPADGTGLAVYALYEHGWAFAVGQLGGAADVGLPDWPVIIDQHPEVRYSARLLVEAPEGTKLLNVRTEFAR